MLLCELASWFHTESGAVGACYPRLPEPHCSEECSSQGRAIMASIWGRFVKRVQWRVFDQNFLDTVISDPHRSFDSYPIDWMEPTPRLVPGPKQALGMSPWVNKWYGVSLDPENVSPQVLPALIFRAFWYFLFFTKDGANTKECYEDPKTPRTLISLDI